MRGIFEAEKAERGKEEGHCVCVCVFVCVHNGQVAGPAGAVAGLRDGSQLVLCISQFEIFVLRFSQVESQVEFCLWAGEEGVLEDVWEGAPAEKGLVKI